MLCCKLNRRGRGSDIFSAQNIDAGESRGGGGGGGVIHGCSHNILFYFMQR